MLQKHLPRSENGQRRTKNSDTHDGYSVCEEKTTPKNGLLLTASVKSVKNKNNRIIEKSIVRPRIGCSKNQYSITTNKCSTTTISLNSFYPSSLYLRPFYVNALVLLIFSSALNFGHCAIASPAKSDSYTNQQQQPQQQQAAVTSTSLDDKTTFSSQVKPSLNNNIINQYNLIPNLNNTQNPTNPSDIPKSIVYRSTGPLSITGFRLESSKHEIEYDDGIPSVMSESPIVLRVFGVGITADTVIAFTTEPKEAGSVCQFPSTLLHKVQEGSAQENTALYEAVLPKSKKSFYLCAKNDPEAFLDNPQNNVPLRHQCNDKWCLMNSHESLLPMWTSIMIICICLCFSALFSGLNLGLMSLDRTELKILRNTGSDQEREYARKIQPVRDQGNYLLCSILLGNVLVNSTFTILLDGLTSGLVAVVCSTIAIVIFGEITPQAICSRHGLAVGAKTIFITKMVMAITFPLAYPTSKILDYLLGEEIGNVYNRERLKELVKVTTGINDLDKNEVNIISGALELRKKTVADVMTHIDDAFMLPLSATLDFETVSEIMKSGFSRIPVYDGDRKNIVTLLYIKDLAFVDPDDNTPLKTLCEFYQNPVHFVFEDYTLDVMFNQFKDGTIGHLAFVHRVNNEGDGDPFYETIGLVTLEDVIEELIQAEIVDETDVFVDNRTKVRRNRNKKQDFTVFAERRENQTIRISPQLTLATFQYLSASVDCFKNEVISEPILRRLLNQDIIHSVKCKGKEKDDPSLYIYTQNKSVDYFVLILEGRVEVTVGKESLLFESGPFTYFGTQALVPNVVVDSPSQMGSLQSLNMDSKIRQTFIPDYSVRAVTDVIYIAIKRSLYMTAKKATLLEKVRKSGTDTNIGDFDDEVEKLLHSLHEDDRPRNLIRGSQSLRKTSALTGSNTASPSYNDFSSQQSRSLAAAVVATANSQGSNSGDINDVLSLSSLMTSEAAALELNNVEQKDDANQTQNVESPLLPKSGNGDFKHNATHATATNGK